MSVTENTALYGSSQVNQLANQQSNGVSSQNSANSALFDAILASALSSPAKAGADYDSAKDQGNDFVSTFTNNTLIAQGQKSGSVQSMLGYGDATNGSMTTTTDKGTVIAVAGSGTGSYAARITRENGLEINLALTKDARVNELEDGGLSVYYPDSGLTRTFAADGKETQSTGATGLTGTAGNDIVFNVRGKKIDAGDGNDIIINFTDNAVLNGGAGNDRILLIGKGQNSLSIDAGDGQDLVAGNINSSNVTMGSGVDAIIGNITGSNIKTGSGLSKHLLGDVSKSSVLLGGDVNNVQIGAMAFSNIRVDVMAAKDTSVNSSVQTKEHASLSSVTNQGTTTIAAREEAARAKLETTFSTASQEKTAAQSALDAAKSAQATAKAAAEDALAAKNRDDIVVISAKEAMDKAIADLAAAMEADKALIEPAQTAATAADAAYVIAKQEAAAAAKALTDARATLTAANTAKSTADSAKTTADNAVVTKDGLYQTALTELSNATEDTKAAKQTAADKAKKAWEDAVTEAGKAATAVTTAATQVTNATNPIAALETTDTTKKAAEATAKTAFETADAALKLAKANVIPFETAKTEATTYYNTTVATSTASNTALNTANSTLSSADSNVQAKAAVLTTATATAKAADEALAKWSNSFGTPTEEASTYTIDDFVAMHNNFAQKRVA